MTPMQVTEARARLGFTISDFANALGVHYRSVQKLERGERPVTRQIRNTISFLLVHYEEGTLVRALARARKAE